MFSENMSLTETVQVWGIIISAVIMLATIAQVFVAYLIAHSVRTYGQKTEAMNASRHINSQWQEFNRLVITDSEFRKTLISMEKMEESEEEIQVRYMIFIQLNIIHDAFKTREISGIKEAHLETNIPEMIGTMKNQKDVVLSILDGARGYDDSFVAECKKHLG